MISNNTYYELFASYTVPDHNRVGYWVDLGANSKGKVIKTYNENLKKWVKVTDATSEDAVAPFIGNNGNWWIDNRDTGISAAGKNPYIGEDDNWYVYDSLKDKYINSGKSSKGTQGEIGPQGPKGDTGSDFKVLGYFNSIEQLQEQITTPEVGEAYGIGTAAPYDIYIYDGVSSTWVNNGSIQGPQGEKGDAFTYEDFTEEQLESLRGPQGIQGVQGEKGDTGETGEQGPKGDTGEKGDAFTFDDFTAEQLESLRGPQGIQGEKGEKGDQGEQGEPGTPGEAGKDFQILGYFDTVDSLNTTIINPTAGAVYGVGAEAPYDIYVWDSVNSTWVNNGSIQGPAGVKGDKGETGPAGKDATINGLTTINIVEGDNISITQTGNTLTISGNGGLSDETDPIFSASPAAKITDTNLSNWSNKQDKLVSGTNIKTINGTPILGSGDIIIEGGSAKDEIYIGEDEPTDGQELWIDLKGIGGSIEIPESAIDLLTYGVKWEVNGTNPVLTRIGNSTMHQTLPIQSKMRGCTLADDGTVNHYFNNNWTANTDGTPIVKDGSDGMVMIEIPEHYVKYEVVDGYNTIRLSEIALAGYTKVDKQYISAYEATIDRTDSTKFKLASVVNTTPEFRGGNNNAEWDSGENTLLGKPSTYISRANFRTYARNRGNENEYYWNMYDFIAHNTLYTLYIVEYANLNSQLAVNNTLTSNGYKQGGLGDGITNLNSSACNKFNRYNPVAPCGYSDSLGNNSGEVAYTMPASYGTLTTHVNRYRGVENPFGHIWKNIDGIIFDIKTDADGGTSTIYIATNPEKYKDSVDEGYNAIGELPRTTNYGKSLHLGTFFPSAIGGSSTTGLCDYFYTTISSSSLRTCFMGGCASNGATAGFASVYSYHSVGSAYAEFGSRLIFRKQ